MEQSLEGKRSLLGDFDFGDFGVLVLLVLFDNGVEPLLVLTLLKQGAHLSETFEQGLSVGLLVFV